MRVIIITEQTKEIIESMLQIHGIEIFYNLLKDIIKSLCADCLMKLSESDDLLRIVTLERDFDPDTDAWEIELPFWFNLLCIDYNPNLQRKEVIQ